MTMRALLYLFARLLGNVSSVRRGALWGGGSSGSWQEGSRAGDWGSCSGKRLDGPTRLSLLWGGIMLQWSS